MSVNVIFEDNHLIAINKISGSIVQGDKTGDKTLADELKDWLKIKYKKPGNVFLGLIHRLDRPTSGAILFAKTGKILPRMNLLFKEHKVSKTYWAIVESKPYPTKGTLKDYLKKNEQKNKSYITSKGVENAKEAILDYELLASSDRYFLLEINPKTGRHHQIRAQLSNMGCIIKGDLKYGASSSNKDGSISLHARNISFIHPVKKEKVKITANVPNDKLWLWFENNQIKNENN